MKFFSKWEMYTEPCPKLYVKRRNNMEIIFLVVGVLLGIGLGKWGQRIRTLNEEQYKPCPHGYDWDDCPDCRH